MRKQKGRFRYSGKGEFAFNLNNYTRKSQVMGKLRKLKFEFGASKTGEALAMARRELFESTYARFVNDADYFPA